MKRKDLLLLTVGGVLALPTCYASTNTADQLEPSLAHIAEYRESDRERGRTQIVLTISGQATKRVVAFANFRVDQAIDDVSENLVPSHDLTLYTNSRIKEAYRVKRSDGVPSFVVRGQIRAASRQATKITRLLGQVQVMTLSDESRSVTVPKLASFIANGGKDANLAKEKLKLQIGTDNDGDKKRIYAFIGGNPTIVRKIQVIDDNGKVLDDGEFGPGFGLNTKDCYFALPRDVDDKMSLKFEVAASQKVLTVPFDFKDIPLP